MSNRNVAPVAVRRGPAPRAQISRWYFAVDPVSGNLYPTSEPGDIQLRVDPVSGNLFPSDDPALPAAQMAVIGGTGFVF